MDELLKLTCNPKVGAGSSFSYRTMEESYILTCRLIGLSVYVSVTARFSRGTDQDACSLLPQS